MFHVKPKALHSKNELLQLRNYGLKTLNSVQLSA